LHCSVPGDSDSAPISPLRLLAVSLAGATATSLLLRFVFRQQISSPQRALLFSPLLSSPLLSSPLLSSPLFSFLVSLAAVPFSDSLVPPEPRPPDSLGPLLGLCKPSYPFSCVPRPSSPPCPMSSPARTRFSSTITTRQTAATAARGTSTLGVSPLSCRLYTYTTLSRERSRALTGPPVPPFLFPPFSFSPSFSLFLSLVTRASSPSSRSPFSRLTQVSPRKLVAETSETRCSLQPTCRLLVHQRDGPPRYGRFRRVLATRSARPGSH